jgi:hypothetical protein
MSAPSSAKTGLESETNAALAKASGRENDLNTERVLVLEIQSCGPRCLGQWTAVSLKRDRTTMKCLKPFHGEMETVPEQQASKKKAPVFEKLLIFSRKMDVA